jgi:hypothetical protein
MFWYRFWKKSGPMAGYDETYRYYDEKPSTEELKCDSEQWAEDMPGGHNSSYTWGFKKVDYPPVELLAERLKRLEHQKETIMDETEDKIKFYKEEIKKAQELAEKKKPRK